MLFEYLAGDMPLLRKRDSLSRKESKRKPTYEQARYHLWIEQVANSYVSGFHGCSLFLFSVSLWLARGLGHLYWR